MSISKRIARLEKIEMEDECGPSPMGTKSEKKPDPLLGPRRRELFKKAEFIVGAVADEKLTWQERRFILRCIEMLIGDERY